MMGTARMPLAALAVLTACSVGVATASSSATAPRGRLVLDRAIGPVVLGMPAAKLHGLGRSRPVRMHNALFQFYPTAGISVAIAGRPRIVAAIETRSPRYRTLTGIGVGTAKGKLGALHLQCNFPNSCQHTAAPPSQAGTAFTFENGRVSEILIAYGD